MHVLTADPVLDQALARIAELTGRLHAVADLHVPRRTLLRGTVCRACGQLSPCPTVRAVRPQASTSQSAA